ncbi:MAG: OmpH family outer membrane protein [Deltaproteobacteria bacterium]|nr:OmpH family outer membrane protein [Deltaproteobacteria bacterium]
MKKLQIGIMVIIVAVIFSGAAVAAELKLGYVNLQKALNECLAGKEAVLELEAETKKRQEQIDVKQEDLKKLNEEIEKKKTVWSADMQEQKQKELQSRMQEFQRFYLQSNDDLKRREQEKKTVIVKDLIEIAKPLAKEKGYTFLFELQGLIYGPPEADLTNDLIKAYDVEYKKAKKENKGKK